MINNPKLLIVEGSSDKAFFKSVLKSIEIDAEIMVAYPSETGTVDGNGKGNAIKTLVLRAKLHNIEPVQTGIILDADLTTKKQGFEKTKYAVKSAIEPFFNITNETTTDGIIFHGEAGITPIGLWIMPSNSEDGNLEDWIVKNLNNTEISKHQIAKKLLDDLDDSIKEFQLHHLSKAELLTMQAWKNRPKSTCSVNQINTQNQDYKSLVTWFKKIFD